MPEVAEWAEIYFNFAEILMIRDSIFYSVLVGNLDIFGGIDCPLLVWVLHFPLASIRIVVKHIA